MEWELLSDFAVSLSLHTFIFLCKELNTHLYSLQETCRTLNAELVSIENAAEYSFLNNTLMTLHAEDGKFNHNITICVTRLSRTEAFIYIYIFFFFFFFFFLGGGGYGILAYFFKGYWDICVFYFGILDIQEFWDMGFVIDFGI